MLNKMKDLVLFMSILVLIDNNNSINWKNNDRMSVFRIRFNGNLYLILIKNKKLYIVNYKIKITIDEACIILIRMIEWKVLYLSLCHSISILFHLT